MDATIGARKELFAGVHFHILQSARFHRVEAEKVSNASRGECARIDIVYGPDCRIACGIWCRRSVTKLDGRFGTDRLE